MKYLNTKPIDAASADQTSITTAAIDASQLYKMSVQIIVGSGTIGGTLQLQVSNDELNNFYGGLNAPVNWSNLGSATSLTTSGITLIAPQDMCYRSLRAVYSNTHAQASTITTVADVAGSLNSTYFTISSMAIHYYGWISVDSGGVDPALPGKTGVRVDISAGDTADTVAAAIRTAFAAVPGFAAATGATNHAIITNSVAGTSAPAADGAAPTGFAFANNAPTAALTLSIFCLVI